MRGNIVLGTLAMLGLIRAVLFVSLTELNRMQTAETAYDARAVETGALEFESRCRPCHGPQGRGTPLAPALNTASLFDGTRLQAAGYAGTVEDFVRGTIAAGRPAIFPSIPPCLFLTGCGHVMPRAARCSIKPRKNGRSPSATRFSYSVRMKFPAPVCTRKFEFSTPSAMPL